MKNEGARRLRPGDLVWWRHNGVRDGVVLDILHKGGVILRVHVEARVGPRPKRYLSVRRIYYREPVAQQLDLLETAS